MCCPGHHPLLSPIPGVQEGHIGSQAPVPANVGDSSTVDLGITHNHEAPPLVVDLDGTLTARGTIRECLCRLARERPRGVQRQTRPPGRRRARALSQPCGHPQPRATTSGDQGLPQPSGEALPRARWMKIYRCNGISMEKGLRLRCQPSGLSAKGLCQGAHATRPSPRRF